MDTKSVGAAAAAFMLALWAGSATAVAQSSSESGAPEARSGFESPDAPSAARRPAPRYYIEFRSRSALSYGHTFVVFGRVGEKSTARNVAGLHPKGGSTITYVIGHILPVPAETGASDGDLEEQYMTARYRVMLSAAQYRSVVAHIRELQENSPAWNAVTYNCNAFVGTIAHFVGLISPPTWLLPEDFINSLRRMNEDRHDMAGQPSNAQWGARAVPSAAASRAMARHVSGKR